MRGEVVQDDPDDLCLRIIPIAEHLHTVRKVSFGAAIGALHMAPAVTGLKEHKQVAGAVALILIIVAPGLARLRSERVPDFPHHLIGTLVATPHGKARVIGLNVEIPHVFPAPDNLRTHGRDTPLLL